MVIPLTIPKEARQGMDLLKHSAFAGKCKAALEEDGIIMLTDERICDTRKTFLGFQNSISAFEFPRYNYEKVNMKPYKYVYGATILHNDSSLPGIVKSNAVDKTHKLWKRDHFDQACSEPVFVPRPGGADEDDGKFC